MLNPAYHQQRAEGLGKGRIYKEAIERKVDEIFNILDKAGFTGEEKDEDGGVTHYTLGLPETLPSLSWFSTPLNWVNKQFTTFIRYPAALAAHDEDPKKSFRQYAKTQIRDHYIDAQLDEALTDDEIKALLSPTYEGTLSVLASSFSTLLSDAIGMDVVLKPSYSILHPSITPLHYVIEGKTEPLTEDQKCTILNWCRANQPSWVVRWWRDQPFEVDKLKMNPKGQLCIESYDLLRMTLQIDPAIPQLLSQLSQYLSIKYEKTINLNIVQGFGSTLVFLNSGNDDDLSFAKRFQKDLLESTKLEVYIFSGSGYNNHPVSVAPYNELQINNAASATIDGTTSDVDTRIIIEERFERKFIAKSVDLEGKGTCFTVYDLRAVLAMARMEAPVYLPLNETKAPRKEATIDIHPILQLTKWHFVGAFVNGKWIGPDGNESNHNNDDSWNVFRKVFGLDEPKQQARLKQ